MSSLPSDSSASESASRPSSPRRGGWLGSLALGVGLLLVYSANDRDLGTTDTVATTMVPLTLLRGEGIYLERFRAILHERNGMLPAFVVRSHGRIVSRYPLAPA